MLSGQGDGGAQRLRVAISAMVDLVDEPSAGDDEVDRAFARLSRAGKRPSVEAVLHAVCLSTGQATVVGHTHPVAVNVVLCSAMPSAWPARWSSPTRW